MAEYTRDITKLISRDTFIKIKDLLSSECPSLKTLLSDYFNEKLKDILKYLLEKHSHYYAFSVWIDTNMCKITTKKTEDSEVREFVYNVFPKEVLEKCTEYFIFSKVFNIGDYPVVSGYKAQEIPTSQHVVTIPLGINLHIFTDIEAHKVLEQVTRELGYSIVNRSDIIPISYSIDIARDNIFC